MNQQERPLERAKTYGIHTLSNRELLAILLRSGTKNQSVLEIADEILMMKANLMELMELHYHDFIQIHGVKQVKAMQLLACFELSKRISLDRIHQVENQDEQPEILSEWLMHQIGNEKQEHFLVLFLNNRGKVIAHKDIFIGTGNKSFANPREVFLSALQYSSSKIICAHNHPSQDTSPSASDFISAKAIEESGDLIGIKVIDHMIVSKCSYYSFKEHMQMQYQKKSLEQLLASDEPVYFP